MFCWEPDLPSNLGLAPRELKTASWVDFLRGQLFLRAEGTELDCLNPSALQQFVSHFLMQQYYSRCLNFSQEKQWEEDAKIKLGG